MKVLFIESEIWPIKKLLKIISGESTEKKYSNYPYMITKNNSTAEDILKELKVNNEMIEEIKSSDLDKILLIILKDGKRLNDNSNHLNFDLKKSGNLKYKNFNVNLDQEEVYINDKRVKLTALKYKLLLFFIYNVKKLIPRQEIIDYLWGRSDKQVASEVTMYTHIKNLKKKLIKSGVGNFIHSVYGQGYKFEDPDDVVL